MINSFQYDKDGFIFARVSGSKIPEGDNVIVSDDDLLNGFYDKTLKKVFKVKTNPDGTIKEIGNKKEADISKEITTKAPKTKAEAENV
jgi:hypothetical protein